MIRRSRFSALGAILVVFGGCSTVRDMVTSNLPESHSGRASIVVSLREQEAYLYRGGHRTASSRISSGREGYRTPLVASTLFGKTKVIALVSMVTTLMTRAASSRLMSMLDAMPNRGIRTLLAARCRTFSNSRRATAYTKVTCRESQRHTAALGCLTGKRASFITLPTSAQWCW